MSTLNGRQQLAQLLHHRWQIPLALIGAVAAGIGMYRLVPPPPPVDFGAVLADITLLRESGDTTAAANAVADLLDQDPPFTPEELGDLHRAFAEMVFDVERDADRHVEANIRNLLKHQEAAWELGQPHDPPSELRYGLALQWLGEGPAALKTLRPLVNAELPADDHERVVHAVVEVLQQQSAADAERRQLLNDLLAQSTLDTAQLWWALRQGVQDALDEGNVARANDLLTRYGDRLATSDLKGYGEFLRALVLLHEGRTQEAEPIVHWIDEWLDAGARGVAPLDARNQLPILNHWLLGRISLAEARPQEAFDAFEDALRRQPPPSLQIAAAIGAGEALAALNRHETALVTFRRAIEDAASTETQDRLCSLLRQALEQLYERVRTTDSLANALPYLALAVDEVPTQDEGRMLELTERLAKAYVEAAQSATDSETARAYYEKAGRAFEHGTDFVQYDEPRLGALQWSAADAYDHAGLIGSLRRVLQAYVRGRTDDPLMPQALLQLGQASEASGVWQDALDCYNRVIAEYPLVQQAHRARVLKAGVLIGLGAERYDEAETTLAGVLQDDVVAPDAPAFRDALLLLCELLYHRGEYARAIGRLDDFLARYPHHEERMRARFMLADAYRHSALALRTNPPANTSPTAVQTEARQRLRTAADLFAALLNDIDAQGTPDDKALQVYTRLAAFYRGDCLFDLNEPATLQEALTAYRNAAARYAGEPAALAAYVQIANIHLRQGDTLEAAHAVEKARWLLRSIPAEAFSHAGTGDRAEWERFLTVVSSSALFREGSGTTR